MNEQAPPLTRLQLTRFVRSRLELLVHDDSGVPASEFAIYTLSDPRDARAVRYVGQTRAPRRRFLQHVNLAQLWLPQADDSAWWVRNPELRPLYGWIRQLHREEYRLPVMIVTRWVDSLAQARSAERTHIETCLNRSGVLFNIEAERAARQLSLALEAGHGNSDADICVASRRGAMLAKRKRSR